MPEWDNDDDDYQDSDLVKNLRAQLKEFKKKNQDLDTELGTLRPQVRKNSIAALLTELGVPTKIAGLLPSEVEPTKDAVKAWVDEYGDVFNLKTSPAEVKKADGEVEEVKPLAGQTTQVVDQATQDAWGRVQGGDAATGATGPDLESQQLAHLGSAMTASNGSYDNFVAILQGRKALPTQ